MVNIVPSDMTRAGWKYTNKEIDPEIIEKIEEEESRLELVKTINQALVFERLYGGAAVLIGTAEKNKDPKLPLVPSTIDKGDVVFLHAIPRQDITPNILENDPLNRYYKQARTYRIHGHEVHRSRLLIFDGGGDTGSQTTSLTGYIDGGLSYSYENDGFGNSILEPVYDDIIRCDGGRQAGFHLVNMLSIPIFQQEMGEGGKFQGGKADKYFIDKLKQISKQMSLYNAAILEPGVSLGNYAANLTGLSEFIATQLKILSAGSDIPAPRYLGEAPGGLNATGKGELRNYYDGIGAEQVQKLLPPLNKFKPMLIRSATGQDYPTLKIEFNPLMQLSEDEAADVRQKDWKNIEAAVKLGLGDKDWARKECDERKIFLNEPKNPPPPVAAVQTML